jgi:hypothetical protein
LRVEDDCYWGQGLQVPQLVGQVAMPVTSEPKVQKAGLPSGFWMRFLSVSWCSSSFLRVTLQILLPEIIADAAGERKSQEL